MMLEMQPGPLELPVLLLMLLLEEVKCAGDGRDDGCCLAGGDGGMKMAGDLGGDLDIPLGTSMDRGELELLLLRLVIGAELELGVTYCA